LLRPAPARATAAATDNLVELRGALSGLALPVERERQVRMQHRVVGRGGNGTAIAAGGLDEVAGVEREVSHEVVKGRVAGDTFDPAPQRQQRLRVRAIPVMDERRGEREEARDRVWRLGSGRDGALDLLPGLAYV
jgi:hypothetical protein